MAGKRTYKVTLTDEERALLRSMLSSGKAAARKLNHARLLLFADEAVDGLRRTDQEIAATLGIGPRTVERVRQRFVEEGLESARFRDPVHAEPTKSIDASRRRSLRSPRAIRRRGASVGPCG